MVNRKTTVPQEYRQGIWTIMKSQHFILADVHCDFCTLYYKLLKIRENICYLFWGAVAYFTNQNGLWLHPFSWERQDFILVVPTWYSITHTRTHTNLSKKIPKYLLLKFPTCVERAQTLRLSCMAIPRLLTGSWIRSGVPGQYAESTGEATSQHRQGLDPWHRNPSTRPLFLRTLRCMFWDLWCTL